MPELSPHTRELLRDPELGAGNFVDKWVSSGAPCAGTISLDGSLELGAAGSVVELGWPELAGLASRISLRYLDLGVEPKDPVALWFEDTVHYLLHYVALTRLGALPVFVNFGLDPRVALQFIRSVGAQQIVTTGVGRARLAGEPSVAQHDVHSEHWFGGDARDEREAPAHFRHQPDDPVLVGHSSGTTGVPKAVRFDHGGFFYGVRRELHKQVGARVLSALPQSHASALSIVMTACLRASALRIQTDKRPLALIRAVETFRPDLFVSFPKAYVDLCRLDLQRYDLSSIAYWLSTGDANHESHIRRLMEQGHHLRPDGTRAPGSSFIDNLGASELGFAAFRNVHRPGGGERRYARRIGRPFDWVDAAVLDAQGGKMGPFQVGRLGVRAPSVTPGYWNNSLLTEKNRVAGYWLTGDLAYQDDDNVFFHVDRTPDAIVTARGVVYSCQAEELVLKHFPEVFDCSIVAARRADGAVVAVVVAELDGAPATEDLLGRVNQVLEQHGVPPLAELRVEATPQDLGVTGKKLKRALRERLAAEG